ncbi:MAG: FAD:protein FMN transferase [Chloroflexi bacterium]|jgi:FAD:protein FMN transferase|nr:FAD:protein FMN transferase [Chloroflexota bacterium]
MCIIIVQEIGTNQAMKEFLGILAHAKGSVKYPIRVNVLKRLSIVTTCLLMLGSIFFASFACNSSLSIYGETHSMWNTTVTVRVYANSEAKAQEAINAAFGRMVEIGDITSSFEPDSQTSRLNRDGYLNNPSSEILYLVNQSKSYSDLTEGSFDITIQPLLTLWSNDLWMETAEVQQQRIDETLPLVGSDNIETSTSRIDFDVDGMEITLGGITKGYAADEALKVLEQMGIEHALVAASGDIITSGNKPDGQPWQVALVNPDDTSQTLVTFELLENAISTSGNYERYFDEDGKVGHIIDPTTGYSAQECISVTIIAETGLQADAMATGVFVLGPVDGMALVELQENVEAYIIDNDREIHRSSGIDKYLVEPS